MFPNGGGEGRNRRSCKLAANSRSLLGGEAIFPRFILAACIRLFRHCRRRTEVLVFFLRRCVRDIELTLVRLHAMLISKHNDLEICLSLRCSMCNSQPASLYLEYLKSIKLLKTDTDCMSLLRQCLYFLASNLDG